MIPEMKKVLFATDLTENARYAFKYAADIAARYRVGLVILHVIEDVPRNAEEEIINMLGEERWEEINSQHRKTTQEVLIGKMSENKMIRLALSGLTNKIDEQPASDMDKEVEIVVQSGNVVEEIIAQSESKGCGMIVMAYVSRNMMERFIVGGVCRKVLKRSKKPVLLVPMPEN